MTHSDKNILNETYNSIKSSFTISFDRSHLLSISEIGISSGYIVMVRLYRYNTYVNLYIILL